MIENELKELGISSENLGTSTGNTWFGEGEELSSYSPVDGKLIGKVKSSTKFLSLKTEVQQSIFLNS